MRNLVEVACQYPQATYTGMQNSFQHEWDFVQSVTLKVGAEFHPLEEALHRGFLTYLFHVA